MSGCKRHHYNTPRNNEQQQQPLLQLQQTASLQAATTAAITATSTTAAIPSTMATSANIIPTTIATASTANTTTAAATPTLSNTSTNRRHPGSYYSPSPGYTAVLGQRNMPTNRHNARTNYVPPEHLPAHPPPAIGRRQRTTEGLLDWDTHSLSPRERSAPPITKVQIHQSHSNDESPRRRYSSVTRRAWPVPDDHAFSSAGDVVSRYDGLINTEAFHNRLHRTCGRFSVFEAFCREAELIATHYPGSREDVPTRRRVIVSSASCSQHNRSRTSFAHKSRPHKTGALSLCHSRTVVHKSHSLRKSGILFIARAPCSVKFAQAVCFMQRV